MRNRTLPKREYRFILWLRPLTSDLDLSKVTYLGSRWASTPKTQVTHLLSGRMHTGPTVLPGLLVVGNVRYEWNASASAVSGWQSHPSFVFLWRPDVKPYPASAADFLHWLLVRQRIRFVTARRYASAVYSVVVSLCPSVTRRHCTTTAKRRITQTTPYDSPVFWRKKSRRNSNGITPNGAVWLRWGRFKRPFSTNISLYLRNGAR